MEESNKGLLFYQRRRKADQSKEEDNMTKQETKFEKLIAGPERFANTMARLIHTMQGSNGGRISSREIIPSPSPKGSNIGTWYEEYRALPEEIRDALPFSEFVKLEIERVGIGTWSKPRGMHKGHGKDIPTLEEKSPILWAKQGATTELFEEGIKFPSSLGEEGHVYSPQGEKEDDILQQLVMEREQPLGGLETFDPLATVDLLAGFPNNTLVTQGFDDIVKHEPRKEKEHSEHATQNLHLGRTGAIKDEDATLTPILIPDIQQYEQTIKKPKDEELNLGKSHQDIPSTCEQGTVVVLREKAPSIEEAKEKEDESLVTSPRNKYISDLLLPSSPSHEVDHHNQFDTQVGKMRNNLSSKGYLHPFWKRPSYACIKTNVDLGTRTEIEVTKGNPLSNAHGMHDKITISSFSLVGHMLDILMFEKVIWGCVDDTSTSLLWPWRWKETPQKGQDEVAGLLLTTVQGSSFDGYHSPNKKPKVTQDKHQQLGNECKEENTPSGKEIMSRRNADLNSEVMSPKNVTGSPWYEGAMMSPSKGGISDFKISMKENSIMKCWGHNDGPNFSFLIWLTLGPIKMEELGGMGSCMHQIVKEELERRLGPSKDGFKGFKITNSIFMLSNFMGRCKSDYELFPILNSYKNVPFEATKSLGNGLEVVGLEEGSKTTIFLDSKYAAISFYVTFSRVRAKLKLSNVEENMPQLVQVGPLLITHWGFSGPVILRLSSWAARLLFSAKYQGTLLVDLTPDLHVKDVECILLSQKRNFPKNKLRNSAPPAFLFVRRFWEYLLAREGLDENILWASVSHRSLQALASVIKKCSFDVSGKGEYKDEFVTAGGVPLSEISLNTMESRICPHLFFAGEVLNADGITGGFNFQGFVGALISHILDW
ncbi:hypothetical protein KI387_029528, partial [Taxus chinensis]